ncbi:MAG TPA: nitrite/sulfite reductase [Candidatus Limnocylindrales bacterium]|nr:nitrite/sulfite reductase [Candidatus Limnocylindrales bacterium]
MYQYDRYDQTIVEERARQFRGQVQRRIDGEVTENEFKPLRLQNGLYMQLHAYMLRIAVPYGVLSSRQVRKLAHIARTYDRGYGHITTRQNIQFNWPHLGDVPTILDELASVEMHAIQTSGNCIRNITSDPFAGVAPDEIEDPRPYCELLRQWSTFHPEFAFLPRKFKIAITGTPSHDRAAIRFHDIGIRIVDNAEGKRGFEIWVGGGMGRTPFIATAIRPFVEYADLPAYLESILRVYNLHGRRDNKHKARIKILVDEIGAEEFTRWVEEDFARSRRPELLLERSEVERIAAFFQPPAYQPEGSARGDAAALAERMRTDAAFARWRKTNVLSHKVAGYNIVVLSLKHPGIPPGDISDTQLDRVADLADRYSFGEVRTTHTQNMVLTDVRDADLAELFDQLVALDMATPNFRLLSDIIACPGLDYCALANARSIPLSLELSRRFDDIDYQEDIGPCSIKISGCINACGHHHVGNIGILGINKNGEEVYQLMLGGHDSDSASLGRILGPALKENQVADAVEKVLAKYLAVRNGDDEIFLDCYRRLGPEPFKEAAYAA